MYINCTLDTNEESSLIRMYYLCLALFLDTSSWGNRTMLFSVVPLRYYGVQPQRIAGPTSQHRTGAHCGKGNLYLPADALGGFYEFKTGGPSGALDALRSAQSSCSICCLAALYCRTEGTLEVR